jgi:hypothetical protein
MATNDDGTWRTICGCGKVCCESGTYEQAAEALDAHRNPEEP